MNNTLKTIGCAWAIQAPCLRILRNFLLAMSAGLSSVAQADTAHITDADGSLSFDWLTLSWDNDFCELTLTTGEALACGDQGCSGLPTTCTTLLNLDGRLYPLTGVLDRSSGPLWTTTADASVNNCRRADSSALPPLQLPALALNGNNINLDPNANMSVEFTHYGARISLISNLGDVVCDGEVSEPISFVFVDSFE